MCQKMLCDLCFKTALRVKLRCYTLTPEDTRPKKSVQTTNSIVHRYLQNKPSFGQQSTGCSIKLRDKIVSPVPLPVHQNSISRSCHDLQYLHNQVLHYQLRKSNNLVLLMQCILLNFKRLSFLTSMYFFEILTRPSPFY